MKRSKRNFYLFIGPWLLGFVFFTLIPMIVSLYISFTKWNILTPAEFIGLENYVNIWNDALAWKSIKITLTYTIFSVPINIILALFVAILLNNDLNGVNVFRTIYYIPAVVSGVVVSLLWKWVFHSEFGLLNIVLSKFGIKGPNWLLDEHYIMPALIIMSIWGVGGSIIMYLSGLQGIPTYLYEAARIDGAGWWERLFKITLPTMSPILLFTTLTSLIGALQTFTQAYVMTDGGPNNGSLFYAYYIYNHAFKYKEMGKACALAWILFIVIFSISAIILKTSSSIVYYESETGGQIL